METNPPAAVIGYAWDGRGFFKKICERCPDKVRAVMECRGLRHELSLCSYHRFIELGARIGERND